MREILKCRSIVSLDILSFDSQKKESVFCVGKKNR